MKIKFKIFALLVFVIVSSPALSLEPVIIDNTLSQRSIGLDLEYLEDREGALTINDITTGDNRGKYPWKKSKGDTLGFGFTKTVYWIKFSMKNTAKNSIDWYLKQGYPLINHLNLYIPERNSKFKVVKTGTSYIFSRRPVKYRTFVFPMRSNPDTTGTYYMRYQSRSSMNIDLTLFSPEEFQEMKDTETSVLWMFYGIIIVMVLYNLFLYFFIRRLEYLYYVFSTFIYILFMMTLNGTAFQYLWPDFPSWANSCNPLMLSILMVFVVLFVRDFLETRTGAPWAYKIFSHVSIVFLIIAIVSFILPYSVAMAISTALTGISLFFGIIYGIVLVYNRAHQSYFYLGACGALFIGSLLFVLKTFSILPTNFFTSWSLQIGSVIMVVLFSIALADRINIMRRELQTLNINLEQNIVDMNTLYRGSFLILQEGNINKIMDLLIRPIPCVYMFLYEKYGNHYKLMGYSHDTGKEVENEDLKELLIRIKKYLEKNPEPEYVKLIEFINDSNADKYFDTWNLKKDENLGTMVIVRTTNNIDILQQKLDQMASTNNLVTLLLHNKNLKRELLDLIEHLKWSDNLKDEFLSNMSHEMNTPIASILMTSEMLKDGDLQKEELPDCFEQLYRDASTLNDLVYSQMLTLKIESGEIEPHIEQVKIISLLNEIITQLNEVNSIEANSYDIKLPAIDIELKTDRELLKKIVKELLENSINYSDSANGIMITAEQNSGKAVVSIIDSGKGIPENHLSEVKEKFFRVDSSITYEKSGTGLGLYTADKLAGILGGKLELRNRAGGGLIAELTLPG